MGRGKVKLIIPIVLAIVLAAWIYKAYANPELTTEEESKIVSLVNSYYNNMMDRDYESALKLIDMSNSDYDKTISTLNNNKDYTVKRRLEGDSWMIPSNGKNYVYYDKESKRFYTEIGALIINKSNSYGATENVYVRKVGKDFKITRITTDDRFGYIRGSFVKSLY